MYLIRFKLYFSHIFFCCELINHFICFGSFLQREPINIVLGKGLCHIINIISLTMELKLAVERGWSMSEINYSSTSLNKELKYFHTDLVPVLSAVPPLPRSQRSRSPDFWAGDSLRCPWPPAWQTLMFSPVITCFSYPCVSRRLVLSVNSVIIGWSL